MSAHAPDERVPLDERWMAAWPEALATWSRFTRLRPPTLCRTPGEAAAEGLTTSFAMIRLRDQAVVVSLPEAAACGVQDFPVEVLAHEIGHHVLAPATLTDHARMIARMRRALPTLERHAAMVANLYTDLLINDRLQRGAGLRMAGIYRAIAASRPGGEGGGAVWALYMRIYELLWGLERGSLKGGKTDDRVDGDAWLGARLVRSYARDWLDGSGRFAALILPYLLEDETSARIIEKLLDTRAAAAGSSPDGLVEADPEEAAGAVHPALDPAIANLPDAAGKPGEPAGVQPPPSSRGQSREPFEYGEILRAAGVEITDHEAAVRYYRERALPHLIPFPARPAPSVGDPLPEGLEPWELGDPLDAADWLESVLQSPHVVPGMTTVRRVWGTTEARDPAKVPLDLDLYVDSSGSMPNPQRATSFPALAGAILCLSALRAGARVQATLWSGARQFITTPGFVRDETEILRVLTGYFGGGTAFPIHVLRDTYAARAPDARPAHVLVISDDGVTTMFSQDERGESGWTVAARSLARAGGGGTFVLNLPTGWETFQHAAYGDIRRARDEQGWAVHAVATLDELVAFARWFSRLTYGPADAGRRA